MVSLTYRRFLTGHRYFHHIRSQMALWGCDPNSALADLVQDMFMFTLMEHITLPDFRRQYRGVWAQDVLEATIEEVAEEKQMPGLK